MMRKLTTALAACMVLVLPAVAQISFNNSNAKLLNPNFHSGCPVTIADWNGDGLDDIIRLDDGRYCNVEVQQTNQQFTNVYLGDFGGGAWAMAVADVDHNGYKDVVADGSAGIGLITTDNTGTGGSLTWLPSSNFFLQNATFGDFNNDGWIDLFCCDDNAASHIYLNSGTGTFSLSGIINFNLPNGSDNSGNYGSVWTDFDNDGDLDLYIAKCRQGVSSPSDPRRIDVLFVNDGSNNYTEMAATYGVANGWQTWTASFGDIDNDGDLDLLATNHDHESQIFENDGTGHYIDITSTTGFDITDMTPIESVMEDFDNDGYIDLFITGGDQLSGDCSRYYKNNGDKTFTRINNLFNSNDMESFAVGDVNHDGFIDVYASYATIYTNPTSINDVIWLNGGNGKHFITLNLKGDVSNIGAIGARATLYSSLGTQIREVRAGESYGTTNSSQLHFGLDTLTVVDSVVIRWPSGTVQTLVNPQVNQFISIVENDCVSPNASLMLSGPAVLCPGQSLTITAPPGNIYSWSDGSNLQSITVSAAGEYSVTLTQPGNACTGVSPTITVISNPDETPVITASASVEFCDGESVDLAGPASAAAYLWSNGETTQSINVTQSGTYSLSIQGVCQWWPSNSINVTVHTPVLPTANDVTLTQPGSTTLTATGNNISWYDAPTGGTLLGTGNNYMTGVLNDTTVFYVQSSDIYNKTEATGLKYSANSYSGGNNTNASMFFTAYTNCTLASVKVYTDLYGQRLIELRNAGTNALIDSELVDVTADSQVVALNFNLTAGTNYILKTNAAVNQLLPGWGASGPRLTRNSSGVSYPYAVPSVLSVTGSDQGATFYYYFYDWQVEYETACNSIRVPVTVFVTGSVGITESAAQNISVYPNPATGTLYIKSPGGKSGAELFDFAGRMVMNETLDFADSKLDVSKLTPGMYRLKISNDGATSVFKVVIR